MSANRMSVACKSAPVLLAEPAAKSHPYNCHMAALHWACLSMGDTEAQAGARVASLARKYCATCRRPFYRGGMVRHDSLDNFIYGRLFCDALQRIRSPDDLHRLANPGDVLITGPTDSPAHSMIVRQKASGGRLSVRGFNNFGCLGKGGENAYDTDSHTITKASYWDGEMFGGGKGPRNALYLIRYVDFAATVRRKLRRGPFGLRR